MVNTRYCEQREDVDRTPIAQDFFRRFSSRLSGLMGPQALGNFASEEPSCSGRRASQRIRKVADTNSPKPSLIPLQLASLCLDCEMITSAHGRCIACGSVALLNIAKTLSHPHNVQLPRSANLARIAIASVPEVCCGGFHQGT
jgi:hypothetical protein